MAKTLEDIIGFRIQNFVVIHDYSQIIMDNGSINIYSPLKCYTKNEEKIKFKCFKREDLINLTISNVEFEAEEYFRIELENKNILEISLLDQDYNGPEAISIHYKTGEIIVV